MASATKAVETKVIEDVTVTLTLSQEEAEFLRDVLAKVGGSPDHSRRKYQEPISDALYEVVGDNWNTYDLIGGINVIGDNE